MEKGLVVHLQKASELEISLSSRKTYFFLRLCIVKIYKSGPGFLVFGLKQKKKTNQKTVSKLIL